MEFTDDELSLLLAVLQFSDYHEPELIQRVVDEIAQRKELASLDFECSSCKL